MVDWFKVAFQEFIFLLFLNQKVIDNKINRPENEAQKENSQLTHKKQAH